MSKETKEVATCRGCGKELIGNPYYMGGNAYHPQTKERCKINFYGGFVCCEECDKIANYEQESSFPGNRMPPYSAYSNKNKAQ